MRLQGLEFRVEVIEVEVIVQGLRQFEQNV